MGLGVLVYARRRVKGNNIVGLRTPGRCIFVWDRNAALAPMASPHAVADLLCLEELPLVFSCCVGLGGQPSGPVTEASEPVGEVFRLVGVASPQLGEVSRLAGEGPRRLAEASRQIGEVSRLVGEASRPGRDGWFCGRGTWAGGRGARFFENDAAWGTRAAFPDGENHQPMKGSAQCS